MTPAVFLIHCRRALVYLVLLLALPPGAAATEEVRVGILLSDEAPVYREMATALEAVVADAGGGRSGLRTWPLAQGAAAVRPTRLLITVGTQALVRALAEAEAPAILATLIPRDAYARLTAAATGKRLSAIFIDQPLARQIDAVAIALPERRRVGVILGPDSQRLLPELRTAAGRRGLTLTAAIATAENEVFAALERVLPEAEVLLATPDPRVFNAGTLPNILLASYRRQIPLVGFSPAYLRAGALLTLQSSPEQMAASAGEIVRAALAARPLPAARHARQFSLTVNRHVARSLGISLAGDDELTGRLLGQEATP